MYRTTWCSLTALCCKLKFLLGNNGWNCNSYAPKSTNLTMIIGRTNTQCGMLSANATDLEKMLRAKGIDTDNIAMDPTLPELKLEKGAFAKWIGMMDDVDETCMKTIDAFKNHPLIPKDVVISGWIWEVETRRLRAPTRDPEKRARTDVTSAPFGVKGKQPPRWS